MSLTGVLDHETMRRALVKGVCIEEQCYSQDQTVRLRGTGRSKELVHTTVNARVSDHFGIAVGIDLCR